MLGSVMDAEDILQEAYLQVQESAPQDIQSPKAYWITVVTRLCIDYLRLARVQREEYIGSWLPEPLIESPDAAPETKAELAESITTAFLLLLEKLEPVDRAVLILHDVFNYTYSEIGGIVGRNPADCRQIGHRARARLATDRPRPAPPTEMLEQVTRQFMRAMADGDVAGLMSVLAEDVVLWSDGGGKVKAAINPIYGSARVIRFLAGIHRKYQSNPYRATVIRVNGRPGLLSKRVGRSHHVETFEVRDGRISAIYRVSNPDKLRMLK